MKRFLVVIYLLSLVTHCWATSPLVDVLDYEGERHVVHPIGKPWLELLENEKTRDIRRQDRCSAIGAPRANWRIVDSRLLLVGLFSCRGEIKLETIYGGDGEPIFAEWITSEIITQRGKQLCQGYSEPPVYETTVFFSVERGLVTNVMQFSNLRNPAVPTFDDVQKIFGPFKDKDDMEKGIGRPGEWPCLNSLMQNMARGTPIPVSSPSGTTFGEYLNENAKNRMER